MEVRRDACFILLIFSCLQPSPVPHLTTHCLCSPSPFPPPLLTYCTQFGFHHNFFRSRRNKKEKKTNFSPDDILLLKTLLPDMFSLQEESSTGLPKDHIYVFLQKNLSSQRSQSDDVRDSLVKMLLLFLLTSYFSRTCRWPISHFLPQDSSMRLHVLPLKLLRQWTSFSGLQTPRL